MTYLIDLFPLVIFFVAYHRSGMFVATGAVMAACTLQTAGYRLYSGAFDKNHLLALGLVVPFGAATLAFRDPAFIKWNGTAEMWLLAIAFLGSQFVGERPIVERMMASSIDLSRPQWLRLNSAWVAFFVVSGACNIIVAYQFEVGFVRQMPDVQLRPGEEVVETEHLVPVTQETVTEV